MLELQLSKREKFSSNYNSRNSKLGLLEELKVYHLRFDFKH